MGAFPSNLPQPGDWQQLLAYIRNLKTTSSSPQTGAYLPNSFVFTDTSSTLATPKLAITNGQLLIGATGTAPQVGTITGSTNQIVVSLQSGSIGLSLPQAIATTSTPTFAGVVLSSTFQLSAGASTGLVLTSNAIGIGTWSAAGQAGSVLWNNNTNPNGNLALNMGANTTLFTWGAATGVLDMLAINDTAGNTGTGHLLAVNTAAGSTARPVQFLANGNGMELLTTGQFSKVGTGSIADALLSSNIGLRNAGNTFTATPQQITIGGMSEIFSSIIFSQTAQATVSNTTTETSLFTAGSGTRTLRANWATVGKTVRGSLWGFYSTSGTPGTLTIRLKLGSTVIGTTGAITPAASVSNLYWRCDFIITCLSVGVTGTVQVTGLFEHQDDTTNRNLFVWGIVNTAATTVDTTSAQLIDCMATWQTASASNSITSANGTLHADRFD